MPTTKSAVKAGLHVLVLGALVAGTGAVIVSDGAGTAAADGGSQSVELAAALALTTGSADVPLLNSDLAPEDVVHVTPASRSVARMALQDGEGVTFTVVIGGVETTLTTTEATLADALTVAGIVLEWDDQVSADLSAAPVAGAEVRIGRATTTYVTEDTVTPHPVEERETADLPVGESRVVQEGVDGQSRVTSEISLIDGVEVSRVTLVSAVRNAAVAEIREVGTSQSTTAAAAATGTPAPASGPVDPGSNRAIAKDMLTARGWGDDQWACLDSLWQKESGWNHLAANRSSGAYGIPQSLPGSKMATAGADWQTNPATQITWGLGYISGRYGTPCGAWSHSVARGWY